MGVMTNAWGARMPMRYRVLIVSSLVVVVEVPALGKDGV